MKITIHRGTDEIGGSCVEISTDKTRILVDIGERLEPVGIRSRDTENPDLRSLPDSLKESLETEPPIAAVLISHAHRDHFGLLPLLPPSIRVYMSEGTGIMMDITQYFGQVPPVQQQIIPFSFWKPFDIGDIMITPFLADHSAMDACSFLISAGNKKLFYTGDIRAHGRKKVLFEKLVAKPPDSIDVLILEGTTLGKPAGAQKDEKDLEKEFVKLFRNSHYLCLVSFSSQNIDRLVTVYRACVRSGRTLVIDPYTAKILESVHTIHETIPNWNWNNVVVFFTPNSHSELLANDKTLYRFKPAKITIEEIREKRKSIVMKLNYTNKGILKNKKMLPGATLIWSQWSEYFKQEEPFWKRQGISPVYLHVSGHAYKEDLQRLAHSMKPGCIIPIHTQHKSAYPEIFAPVKVNILGDGERFFI